MFDLIVFCLGQKTASIPPNNIYIEPEQRYSDIWKFISEQHGIWYNLYMNEAEFGGTELCEHLGFEEKTIVPKAFDMNFKGTECVTVYRISKDYIDTVKQIIDYYIACSPMKTVLCLARYQCDDKEIVRGVYTVDKFFSLMQHDQIYANVCYILSENGNALT